MRNGNGKFTVHRIGDAFVVSDDGRIAAQLGLEERVEWHIVAPHAGLLGDRIDRMGRLLEAVAKRTTGNLMTDVTTVTAGATAITTAAAPMNVQIQLPAPGSKADSPIDDLPAAPQVRWRLRKAGVETIGQLAGLSTDELAALPGVGPRIVAAVERGMDALGFRLKQAIA